MSWRWDKVTELSVCTCVSARVCSSTDYTCPTCKKICGSHIELCTGQSQNLTNKAEVDVIIR